MRTLENPWRVGARSLPGACTEYRYRIGQFAAEFGLNAETLRYYEELGLLTPEARTPADYRQYASAERETPRVIVKAKASGLTLAEIGDILALRRAGREPCRHGRAVLDRTLAAVGAQLRTLAAFRDELLALRDSPIQGTTCDGAVCGIIERQMPRQLADPEPAV